MDNECSRTPDQEMNVYITIEFYTFAQKCIGNFLSHVDGSNKIL